MNPCVHPIAGFDLRLTDASWAFAEERREEIAAHWQEQLLLHSEMWDGEILLCRDTALRDGVISGSLMRVRFSAFLAWRAWGWPESGVRQIGGVAIIRGADGALVFGREAPHMADAGAVCPPGGMLDMHDVGPDGKVDVFASTARELTEETGLRIEDGRIAEDFLIPQRAFYPVSRVIDFPLPAGELAAQIRDNLRQQEAPELADAFVFRNAEEVEQAGAQPYWVRVARHVFDHRGKETGMAKRDTEPMAPPDRRATAAGAAAKEDAQSRR